MPFVSALRTIVFPVVYMSACMLQGMLSHSFLRFQRVRKINHSQVNEDYSPEQLYFRRAPHFPTAHMENLLESARDVVNASAKFTLEPISATNRVRRRHLSPAFLSYRSYPLLSGKLRMYLGISACHRRLRFLLQPRHRPSCSGLMGQ